MLSASSGVRAIVYAIAGVLLMFLVLHGGKQLEAQVAGDGDGQAAMPAVDGDGAAAGEAAAPAKRSWGQEFFQRPQKPSEWIGVGFYIVLLIFSIVAATVTIERLVRLTRQRVLPTAFVKRLQELVRTRGDTQAGFRDLANSSNAIAAEVLKAALVRAGRPVLEVEKGMEDSLAREISALRGRHRVLSVLGQVAPLVGLFGTVVGIMFAFNVVSQAGLGKAELMADGINVALRTTAMGLTIAVPCILVVAWFNARIDGYMRDVDEALLQTLPGFARMEQGRDVAAGAKESSNGDATADEARMPISAK